MRTRNLLSALSMAVILALAGSADLAAQEAHVVDRAELERVTAETADGEEARRQAIRSVLESPEVRETAGAHGIEVTRAEDAVATLEGESLARVYEQALRVEAALSGGDTTIVLSSTAVIIILLVLILIAVD